MLLVSIRHEEAMMSGPVLSLHHVTATADDAQRDLDCYVGLLGLRLVKKTVNFDNHNVYHFYYGDAQGTPSTIWTTFPYKGWGVPVGVKGAGQITVTSFSVPAESLDFWRARLQASGITVTDLAPRFEEASLVFVDPSGLVIELVGTRGDPRTPWVVGGVGPGQAIRGIHSVSLTVRTAGPTLEFLTGVLGWAVVAEEPGRTRVGIGDSGPGSLMDVIEAPGAPPARNGLGTVHHVAMAIGSDEEQLALRERLLDLGVGVTEVRDRQYFQSIYFREPGGVLYEVATVNPGFAVDEEPRQLGQALKLPPWEEPHRAAIEAGLPKIRHG
jgi:glyoxalase family protein